MPPRLKVRLLYYFLLFCLFNAHAQYAHTITNFAPERSVRVRTWSHFRGWGLGRRLDYSLGRAGRVGKGWGMRYSKILCALSQRPTQFREWPRDTYPKPVHMLYKAIPQAPCTCHQPKITRNERSTGGRVHRGSGIFSRYFSVTMTLTNPL